MIKIWISAFRLRTLPLALSSIGMGGFLAFQQGAFDWKIMSMAVLTTIFLQILSNLANDYGDSIHGADSEAREGPSRSVQAGLISKSKMLSAIILFGILSLISGIYLLYISIGGNFDSFLFFFGLGLLCIVAAITYTIGKRPYGYAGLGDISVLIFFGFAGVLGSHYLFVNQLDWEVVLPALSCGLLSVAVLNINNTRDIESDKRAGKYSIPVRIGLKNAKIYQWILLIGSMASISIYASINFIHYTEWIFVLSFPLFILNGVRLWMADNSSEMDPLLKQLALSTLLFVLLFGIGSII